MLDRVKAGRASRVLAALAALTRSPLAGGKGLQPKRAAERETQMAFRILDDIVAMVARVHTIARKVARFDRDLARQMTRSSASVGLNAGEGLHGRGGTRTVRLNDAMCSGRETIMALRIAGACGYVDGEVVASEVDTIDRVVAILFKLAR